MSTIKQKIINFIRQHRLLVVTLALAVIIPTITSAAGDVLVRPIYNGRAYLANRRTGLNMIAGEMKGPKGETYFCVSQGLTAPDYLGSRGSYGSFSSPRKMDDLAAKVLLLGYPNRQLPGGFNAHEQYSITQYAFWATTTHYDLEYAPSMRYNTLDNLYATNHAGGLARNKKILQATKDLLAKAKATSMSTFIPTVSISGSDKAVVQDGNIIAGPFIATGKNISSVSMSVTASGANSTRIYNEKGQTITTVGLNQKFYVSFPKSKNNLTGKVTLKLSGGGNYLVGYFYKAPHRRMQDMARLVPVKKNLSLTAAANWEIIPTGRIEISKTDLNGGKPVAGATIEIYDATGKKVYSAVSNAQGKILSPVLTAGKYTFKETIAPAGYKRNTAIGTIQISQDGQIAKASIKNERIPDTPVVIKKVDVNTKKVLRGAKIEVARADGKKIFTGTTDQTGIVKIGDLKAGKYTYREIQPPAGYQPNNKVHDFTITAGETQKTLLLNNTPIKKIVVCDLTTRAMATIEEPQFNTAKHSKNPDDCVKIDVCDLSTRKPVSIIKTAFDKTKHSTNWDDCESIKVCDLTTRKSITIIKTAFDKNKHSYDLDDCTSIEVCDLTTRKSITIIKTAFDKTKHSNNWADCEEIEVCDLTSKEIVKIVESQFDENKYSRNLDDCNIEIQVCDLTTKQIVTINETDFDETKHSRNEADCEETVVETPPELPKTGPLETAAALIAIAAVTLSVGYWYKSVQAVKKSQR